MNGQIAIGRVGKISTVVRFYKATPKRLETFRKLNKMEGFGYIPYMQERPL